MTKEGGTTFTFVTDGIERALEQAKEAAIHLVPILLGDGIRLFDDLGAAQIELETTRVVDSPGVTHLRFRVAG